jgi:hypothetical protein
MFSRALVFPFMLVKLQVLLVKVVNEKVFC